MTSFLDSAVVFLAPVEEQSVMHCYLAIQDNILGEHILYKLI